MQLALGEEAEGVVPKSEREEFMRRLMIWDGKDQR